MGEGRAFVYLLLLRSAGASALLLLASAAAAVRLYHASSSSAHAAEKDAPVGASATLSSPPLSRPPSSLRLSSAPRCRSPPRASSPCAEPEFAAPVFCFFSLSPSFLLLAPRFFQAHAPADRAAAHRGQLGAQQLTRAPLAQDSASEQETVGEAASFESVSCRLCFVAEPERALATHTSENDAVQGDGREASVAQFGLVVSPPVTPFPPSYFRSYASSHFRASPVTAPASAQAPHPAVALIRQQFLLVVCHGVGEFRSVSVEAIGAERGKTHQSPLTRQTSQPAIRALLCAVGAGGTSADLPETAAAQERCCGSDSGDDTHLEREKEEDLRSVLQEAVESALLPSLRAWTFRLMHGVNSACSPSCASPGSSLLRDVSPRAEKGAFRLSSAFTPPASSPPPSHSVPPHGASSLSGARPCCLALLSSCAAELGAERGTTESLGSRETTAEDSSIGADGVSSPVPFASPLSSAPPSPSASVASAAAAWPRHPPSPPASLVKVARPPLAHLVSPCCSSFSSAPVASRAPILAGSQGSATLSPLVSLPETRFRSSASSASESASHVFQRARDACDRASRTLEPPPARACGDAFSPRWSGSSSLAASGSRLGDTASSASGRAGGRACSRCVERTETKKADVSWLFRTSGCHVGNPAVPLVPGAGAAIQLVPLTLHFPLRLTSCLPVAFPSASPQPLEQPTHGAGLLAAAAERCLPFLSMEPNDAAAAAVAASLRALIESAQRPVTLHSSISVDTCTASPTSVTQNLAGIVARSREAAGTVTPPLAWSRLKRQGCQQQDGPGAFAHALGEGVCMSTCCLRESIPIIAESSNCFLPRSVRVLDAVLLSQDVSVALACPACSSAAERVGAGAPEERRQSSNAEATTPDKEEGGACMVTRDEAKGALETEAAGGAVVQRTVTGEENRQGQEEEKMLEEEASTSTVSVGAREAFLAGCFSAPNCAESGVGARPGDPEVRDDLWEGRIFSVTFDYFLPLVGPHSSGASSASPFSSLSPPSGFTAKARNCGTRFSPTARAVHGGRDDAGPKRGRRGYSDNEEGEGQRRTVGSRYPALDARRHEGKSESWSHLEGSDGESQRSCLANGQAERCAPEREPRAESDPQLHPEMLARLRYVCMRLLSCAAAQQQKRERAERRPFPSAPGRSAPPVDSSANVSLPRSPSPSPCASSSPSSEISPTRPSPSSSVSSSREFFSLCDLRVRLTRVGHALGFCFSLCFLRSPPSAAARSSSSGMAGLRRPDSRVFPSGDAGGNGSRCVRLHPGAENAQAPEGDAERIPVTPAEPHAFLGGRAPERRIKRMLRKVRRCHRHELSSAALALVADVMLCAEFERNGEGAGTARKHDCSEQLWAGEEWCSLPNCGSDGDCSSPASCSSPYSPAAPVMTRSLFPPWGLVLSEVQCSFASPSVSSTASRASGDCGWGARPHSDAVSCSDDYPPPSSTSPLPAFTAGKGDSASIAVSRSSLSSDDIVAATPSWPRCRRASLQVQDIVSSIFKRSREACAAAGSPLCVATDLCKRRRRQSFVRELHCTDNGEGEANGGEGEDNAGATPRAEVERSPRRLPERTPQMPVTRDQLSGSGSSRVQPPLDVSSAVGDVSARPQGSEGDQLVSLLDDAPNPRRTSTQRQLPAKGSGSLQALAARQTQRLPPGAASEETVEWLTGGQQKRERQAQIEKSSAAEGDTDTPLVGESARTSGSAGAQEGDGTTSRRRGCGVQQREAVGVVGSGQSAAHAARNREDMECIFRDRGAEDEDSRVLVPLCAPCARADERISLPPHPTVECFSLSPRSVPLYFFIGDRDDDGEASGEDGEPTHHSDAQSETESQASGGTTTRSRRREPGSARRA
ncbi:hypothetical protein BESB_074730 [Besnoitia besnoiti]|uniref:Uncharacterized protein n=1 Tax=Besnoitia besnoiti TaxID=94643 RepID=A0A2A9MDF3_BESBE|nr:uncharacterized protein BESB_074730 [Besnoitia besnoiti]PFH34321.1 hypothetical protein BESB_074730 [Besnoitia besnoiti]